MKKSERTNQVKIKYMILSAFCVISLAFTQGVSVQAEESDIEKRLAAQRAMEIQTNQIPNWPAGPVISAESAILMEADTGAILYGKNIHLKEYPASTTKIMTTLLATELCSLDETVSFSHDAVFDNPPGSSGIAMDVGQQLTMDQCLNAILIRSANEVSFAVAEHITGTTDWSVFAKLMNDRATELGALNTHFVNPNGLPDENHYTTAYDLAMIGRAFFANELLCKITLTRRLEIPASDTIPEAKLENNAMQIIPGGKYAYEYLVGCKTGYTNVARSCLVSCAEKDGLRLICVVMKDESPLQYEDTISLFQYGFSNFDKVNVSQTETKFNIENSGGFYGGSDIFGNSKPLLSLNKNDCIVLPRTITFNDLESTISYQTDSSEQAALISYCYQDVTLGTVRIDFVTDDTTAALFHDTENSATIKEDHPKHPVIFINVLKILAVLAAVFLIGILALCIKAFLRNYQFSLGHSRRFGRKGSMRRRRSDGRRRRR